MSGYEDEYRGCIESGSFDVALYNECGYLHGDPLVVIPPAPTKRAFCLLRDLPTSDRRYKQLTKALKHFGYATLWNVDSLWSVNYYDDGPSYARRDLRSIGNTQGRHTVHKDEFSDALPQPREVRFQIGSSKLSVAH